MDISSLYTADKHNDGAEMRVVDEFGKDTEFYIRLAGQDSDIWLDINKKKQQADLARILNKEDAKPEDRLSMILEATLDWRGVDLEFSKEAALVLYQKAPYILDQAILFIYNRVNFTVS